MNIAKLNLGLAIVMAAVLLGLGVAITVEADSVTGGMFLAAGVLWLVAWRRGRLAERSRREGEADDVNTP
jgi:hypothetical protein